MSQERIKRQLAGLLAFGAATHIPPKSPLPHIPPTAADWARVGAWRARQAAAPWADEGATDAALYRARQATEAAEWERDRAVKRARELEAAQDEWRRTGGGRGKG
jgi:hypothetical protein